MELRPRPCGISPHEKPRLLKMTSLRKPRPLKDAPPRKRRTNSCRRTQPHGTHPRGIHPHSRTIQCQVLHSSIADVSATMHVLNADRNHESTLGPTLMVQVNFKGAPVDALVDTGSPVTIVSLNFLLRTLTEKRPKGQTTAEWEKR